MLTPYIYDNNILAICGGGDSNVLAIFLDTIPIRMAIVEPSDLGTEADYRLCPLDMQNITDVFYDGEEDKLYVVCNTTPAKLFVLDGDSDTWSSAINLTNLNPTHLISDDNYLYIATAESPANVEVRALSDNSYIDTIALTYNACYDIVRKDTENSIWGVLYTTDGTGKIFRIEVESGDVFNVTYFDIAGMDKLYTLSFDNNNILWVGSADSPGKIASCELESGDNLDITITTLDGGQNNLSNLTTYLGKIYGVLDETVSLIKFWQDSGGLDWVIESIEDSESGDLLPNNCSVIAIDKYIVVFRENTLYSLDISIKRVLNTDFRRKLRIETFFKTLCEVVFRTSRFLVTSCIAKILSKSIYKTDCRCRVDAYDEIQPTSFSNLLVKKDGVELPDVGYNSLNISLNLDATPSSATFILARNHDNLDKTLDGATSIITEENKITIFDGTKLLFTGYITQINPSATETNDSVNIIAEDCRYKLKKQSVEIEYGGKWDEDNSKKIEISTKEALVSVLDSANTIIAGYEAIPFGFVPEYSKVYNDYASLIDELVRSSGTFRWYVDENEFVRFQSIGKGTIKTLDLSSLDVQRHMFDVVIDDITLNKQQSNYVTQLEVLLGKERRIFWRRSSKSDFLLLKKAKRDYPEKQLEWFGFQQFVKISQIRGTHYVGQVSEIISSYNAMVSGSPQGIIGYFIFQWLHEDVQEDQEPYVIGTPGIKKTVDYSSYGKQISGSQFIEKSVPKHWTDVIIDTRYLITEALFSVAEETFDYTQFAIDAATFELYQNNRLITEANVQIILDTYEHYGIGFKNLINIGNTLEENIYKDNNGFPLNISSISIDFGTKLVTLGLTNYGQTFYKRNGNIMKNYTPKKEQKVADKFPQLAVRTGIISQV